MKSAFVVLMLSAASCALGQDGSLSLSWLPDRPMMPHFAANSTAHGISITRILKNNQYIGGMGSVVPVVDATFGGQEVQFVVGGTVYTQLLRSSNHLEVVNIDYYVDLLADYRLDEERILRFGYGHTSQHFVDDAYEILGLGHSINYVRDYFQFYALQQVALIRGFVYGGALYHYRFKIPQPGAHHWLLQVGGEGLNREIAKNLFVYLAADIKFREESGYATTQNYQLGVRLRGSTHALRLAFGHRTGMEERGQFYNQRVHWNTLGFFYDF